MICESFLEKMGVIWAVARLARSVEGKFLPRSLTFL